MASNETIAMLMAEFRRGNRSAAGRLTELLYPELRRIAALRMKNERVEHTWQPTVLINELYLELLKTGPLRQPAGEPQNEKDSFLNFAAHLMKRLLIHHARPAASRAKKVALNDTDKPAHSGTEALLELEDILGRLGKVSLHLRAVVQMKVFEGLSREEIAERLGCHPRTVTRHWEFAKTWLQHEITGDL